MKTVRGLFGLALATAFGLFVLFMLTAIVVKYTPSPISNAGKIVEKFTQPHGL